ncbi:hypothetical protein ACQY0O_005481 [Thecaphora frezii]
MKTCPLLVLAALASISTLSLPAHAASIGKLQERAKAGVKSYNIDTAFCEKPDDYKYAFAHLLPDCTSDDGINYLCGLDTRAFHSICVNLGCSNYQGPWKPSGH